MNQPAPPWLALIVAPTGAVIIGGGIACWIRMCEMLHRMSKEDKRNEGKD